MDISQEQKELLHELKSIFHHFQRAFTEVNKSKFFERLESENKTAGKISEGTMSYLFICSLHKLDKFG